ncbi:MAG: PAS domain-containing protein, partial [Alphaproteobacteria bacterium]
MTPKDRKKRQELLDLMVDAVCVCQDGQVAAVNAAGRRLLSGTLADGEAEAAILGEYFESFLSAGETGFSSLESLASARIPVRLTLTRLDGEEVQVELLASTSAQEPGAIIVVIRDVSERVHALDVVRQREDRLRGILEAAPVAIVVCNQRAKILSANSAALSLFARDSPEVVGKSLSILLPDLKELSIEGSIGTT